MPGGAVGRGRGLDRRAQPPEQRLRQRQHLHLPLIARQREGRQHGHAQPCGHHGQYGGIVRGGDLQQRRSRRQQPRHVLLRAGEERLLQQPLQRDGILLPGEVRRHHRHQRRVCQRRPVKALAAGFLHQRQLHPLLLQRGGQLIAAHQHVDLDLRVQLAEFGQQRRKPRPGDTGKAADAQDVVVGFPLQRRLLPQRIAGAEIVLNIGQQVLALLREPDAVAAAGQQGAAQLGLQLVDQMCHGRLGIAQLRRRFSEAAALHRCQQCPQLFVVHSASLSVQKQQNVSLVF